MAGYIGVGHGTKPDGVYDPGAISVDGKQQEHLLNHRVAEYVAQGLARSGEPYYLERDSGNGHDPNFVGSIKKVNEGGYAYAVEVHFDWHKAPEGGFGLYYPTSSGGKLLADKIRQAYQSVSLPVRNNTARDDLSFLKRTNPHAVIWECSKVQAYSEKDVTLMGEAIAKGICDYVREVHNDKIVYKPRNDSQPAPSKPPGDDACQEALERERSKNKSLSNKLKAAKARADKIGGFVNEIKNL